jgi:hypothetical protein
MSLSKLIRKREVATATVATSATVTPINTPSVATVASVAVANLKSVGLNAANNSQPIAELVVAKIASKPETRKERHREEGRQKAIAMMESSPDVPRGIYVDTEIDPDNVIVFVASREYQQTCVLLIAHSEYDPFKVLALIERQGGQHVD